MVLYIAHALKAEWTLNEPAVSARETAAIFKLTFFDSILFFFETIVNWC